MTTEYRTASDIQRRDACRRWLVRALDGAITQPRDLEAELVALHVAACEWATRKAGFIPSMEQVEAIDRQSMGHVDWFDKLTLRVADLVTFGTAGQP